MKLMLVLFVKKLVVINVAAAVAAAVFAVVVATLDVVGS